MDFNLEHKKRLEEVESIIKKYLPLEKGYQKIVIEAMNYSVVVGGKRVRYKQLHLNWKDVITLCASLVLLVFLIVVGPKLNAL